MDVSLSIPVKNFIISPWLPFWVEKSPTNLRLAMTKAKSLEVQIIATSETSFSQYPLKIKTALTIRKNWQRPNKYIRILMVRKVKNCAIRKGICP